PGSMASRWPRPWPGRWRAEPGCLAGPAAGPRVPAQKHWPTLASARSGLAQAGPPGAGRGRAGSGHAALVAVAQFALEHLADGAARQLIDQAQVGQALGLAHALVEPRAQRLGRLGRAGSRHDEG